MTEKKHALLSPSAAHRWLNCLAAPRLEEGEEDKPGIFAREGTLAHAVAAYKLKTAMGMPADAEREEIKTAGGREQITPEMDEHTESYKNFVVKLYDDARKRAGHAALLVERRLDLSEFVPESFGTADAIIAADGTTYVIDFKYGRGVFVPVKHNPQLMIYALGALGLLQDPQHGTTYDIEHINMVIDQPRRGNRSGFRMSAKELRRWADDVLTPKAVKAFKGGEPASPGDWCRFCKVRSRCRALAQMSTETATTYQAPELMTPDEVAREILPKLEAIKIWVAGVEEHTLKRATEGETYPGYKLVKGRRRRKITDPVGAAEALRRHGYKATEIYKPQEIQTITNLERLTGKNLFKEICGPYTEHQEGKPKLVPDERQRKTTDAATDFDGINIK